MKYLSFLIVALLLLSCNKEDNKNPLREILASNHPAIKTVMDNLETHEVQIKISEVKHISTSIEEQAFDFQVEDKNYFYPASSVKFPIAVLALEKANSIAEINSNTPFVIEGDSIFSSIRDNVTAIFAVSDNIAYNRLYEFLGRDYINMKLKEKGLQPVRISHRLEVEDAEKPNTKSIIFKLTDSTSYEQASLLDSKIEPLQLHKLQKGKGYYKNDKLINEPMDFSRKNYLPISTLHELMKRVQYPDAFAIEEQFKIDKEDYDFLLKVMKARPREVGYDHTEYYDGYVKFFMFGDTKKHIPDYINISNKVGYAYGYLTDCALIEDQKNDISFLITATVHVNKDNIFNDDVYEYESVGIPFLAEIGRQLHNYYVKKELSTDEHNN